MILYFFEVNGRKSLPPGKLIAGDLKTPRARVRDLFAPSLRRTTLLLWVIWFCNTFVYYGLVLFTPGLC